MSAPPPANDALHDALATVAPGRPLRDGLERIVRAKMGALLVLADTPAVLGICSGGFLLDADFTPQRLSELAKMDGAIILDPTASRIARANVHLVPDPTVPTHETGTRHRTAERVARSLGVPVVSISEEMSVINLYAGGFKHQLQDIGRLLDRANQALQTLERYKARLDDALSNLTALELEDVVTVRDVATVVQRGEMVRRIGAEIETMIVELGVEARLLRLQLDESYGSLDKELELVLVDYPTVTTSVTAAGGSAGAAGSSAVDGDTAVATRGRRLLERVTHLSAAQAELVADAFGEFAKLQRATATDIAAVAGIDPALAQGIKDTLNRLAETSILEQYRS